MIWSTLEGMFLNLQLTNYQARLLSRGVQSRMNPTKMFDCILDTAIEYAGAVGVAILNDMAYVNERVGGLFSVNGLVN